MCLEAETEVGHSTDVAHVCEPCEVAVQAMRRTPPIDKESTRGQADDEGPRSSD